MTWEKTSDCVRKLFIGETRTICIAFITEVEPNQWRYVIFDSQRYLSKRISVGIFRGEDRVKSLVKTVIRSTLKL